MKFNTFISRIEDVELVQKYSERVNSLCGILLMDLTEMQYRILKHEVPQLIGSGLYEEAITEVLWSERSRKLRRFKAWRRTRLAKKVKKQDNYKKLKFLFWIQDQYKLINELEQRYLSSPPDGKLIQAGIQDLDVLGDKNILDQLAGGDVLKWEQIEQLPYGRVFDKQLKNVIEARISKKLNKIK